VIGAAVLVVLATWSHQALGYSVYGSWCVADAPQNKIPYKVNSKCPEHVALVDAAAGQWNTVFANLGYPWRLMNMGMENAPSCVFGPAPACAGVPPHVFRCDHGPNYLNAVDWCLAKDIQNQIVDRGYYNLPAPVGTLDSVEVEALAVTFPNIGADCCIVGADICVMYAFRDCMPIMWHTGLGAPAATDFDMYSVLVHEFGHYLGLDHTNMPNNVMRPFISPGQQRRTPGADDIAAITAIYAVPRFVWGANSTEETTWGRVKGLYQ
jgi:hypothetical protein